jgi:ATP-binding cassette subfamily B protein
MNADEILVLDGGRVVQRGTHEKLKDSPGMYQRVWMIQNTMEDA